MRRRALLAAGLAPALVRAAAMDEAALRRTVEAVTLPLMAAQRLPGLAVGVAVQGRASCFGHGVTAPGGHEPVTAETIFELGSIGKTFVATLAAWAAERGRLAFDDPPGRHWPALRGRPIDAATLLHLGTHTAGGLPLQFPASVRNEAEIEAFFQAWQPAGPPGTLREYSNPSAALLGRIAARALSQGFVAAMERELLPALGLASSFVHVPSAAEARYAWGDDGRGGRVRVNPGPMADEAYGLKATVADVLRFVQLQFDPTPLPELLRRAVAATQRGHFQTGPMVQGLGWEQYPHPAPLARLLAGNAPEIIFERQPARALGADAGPRGLFNKTGSTGGFGGYVAFVPSRQVGVVLLANRNWPIGERVRAGAALLEALAALPR